MIAVLMAGGEGQRLRPLTTETPKPMLPVGGRPVLDILVRQLVKAGCEHLYLNVRYRREQIEAYFGDGSTFGVPISYLVEPEPYGTAGGLTLLPAPDGPFLVVNADVLAPIDFAAFHAWHVAEQNALSLIGRPYYAVIPYGLPIVRGGYVVDCQEKAIPTRVNSGIYCLDSDVLGSVRAPSDMPSVIRWACARHRVGLYPYDGPYHEIGTVESYRNAAAFYEEHMR